MSQRDTRGSLPSNQKFGWFFVLVFTCAGAYAYSKVAIVWAVAFGVLAILFAASTALKPQLLTPLNRLWFQLGILLGKIVSPVVLGIIFFVLITPVSLMTRLFGRDVLKMKKREVSSYWVLRDPPGPASESFKQQF